MVSSTFLRLWVRAPLMWMGWLRRFDDSLSASGEKAEVAARPLISFVQSAFTQEANL